ncbi:MAG: hypothetical protein KF900_13405 [Bacteroidetes bacterium]|nr:hypothetical protein [Bacteroidota bacterium]
MHSQSDPDSLRYAQLDSLTPEQLLEYYINEPEPYPFPMGPVTVGDSVYTVLNNLTVPTETVDIEFLQQDEFKVSPEESYDTPDYQFKPKIALGMGRMAFHGDLYQKHWQSPMSGRAGFDLAISQRLTRYLQLNFAVLFGKLGANEWLNNRQENFQSEIRAGGLNLLYDFGNFIPDQYRVRPYVSLGVMGFEFLSKTDLKDKNGNTYYYWSDGSIKSLPQHAPNAQNAVNLVRDYHYETDIRELNKDGFGKYAERAWAFPLGIGFIAKVSDRIDVKMNFQYYLTTTDYIDGITNKGMGSRMGNKSRDNFSYTSVSLQYDLITKQRPLWYGDTAKFKALWLADNADDDRDGVPDIADDCLGTELGAPVNGRGCPLDDDKDGIPNYRDDELDTPLGVAVNDRGVGQSDEYWADWRERYLNDSTSKDVETEIVGNWYASEKKKIKEEDGEKNIYTVELMRYNGAIPSDELAFLLSVGDINSTTLDDGTTVVYTTGSYEKLSTAVKRRDGFRSEGHEAAGVSQVKAKGKSILQMPDNELELLLSQEIEDLLRMDIGGGGTNPNDANSNSPKLLTQEDLNKVVSENNNNTTAASGTDIVYRVQLGAFKNRISSSVFSKNAGVVELTTSDNIYKYVTKGFRTISEAAAMRADLVVEGYSDAFITAYRGGERITLREAGASVHQDYQEDINETKTFSSINKNLVSFKVQLGTNKKPGQQVQEMDEQVKGLEGVEKQQTASGSTRYTAGSFKTWDEAETYRQELKNQGFNGAFVIAMFKNEIITKVEAMELTK